MKQRDEMAEVIRVSARHVSEWADTQGLTTNDLELLEEISLGMAALLEMQSAGATLPTKETGDFLVGTYLAAAQVGRAAGLREHD